MGKMRRRLRERERRLKQESLHSNLVIKTNAQASKLMKDITDDILSEIIFRIPNRLSLAQCTAVSKQWHSIISEHNFTCTFLKRLRQKEQEQEQEQANTFVSMESFEVSSKLYSKQFRNAFKAHKTVDGYTVASCHDLALMLPGLNHSVRHFEVFNTATGDKIALPDSPVEELNHAVSCGLISRYNPRCVGSPCSVEAHFSHKVLIVTVERADLVMAVYCSEAKKWDTTTFVRPSNFPVSGRVLRGGMIAADGFLWAAVQNIDEIDQGVIAFDPFSEDSADPMRCFFVGMPEDLGQPCGPEYDAAEIGCVKGRLRMFKLYERERGGLLVKIWELSCNGNSFRAKWSLVHDVRVHWKGCWKVSFLSFDPNDGDIVYLRRNYFICKHRVSQNTYETFCKVVKFPEEHVDDDVVLRCLRIFPIPSWPTPIKSPASSEDKTPRHIGQLL